MTIASQYAGTVASQGGTIPWTSPDGAQGTPDNIYATQDSSTTIANNAYLVATNFGFSIPTSAVITSISVSFFTYSNQPVGTNVGNCYLTLNGTTNSGNNVFTDNVYVNDGGPFAPEGKHTFGSSSGTWGLTLAASDINSSSFGVRIQLARSVRNFVDGILMVINYTFTPSPTPTPTPTTTPSVPLDPAEIAAGVSPTNGAYPAFHPKRYGAIADGTTDDTTAMTTWASVVNHATAPLIVWTPGMTILTGPIPDITTDKVTWYANGCTIKVKANSWGLSGDGSTHLSISGSMLRLHDLIIDGNQSSFSAAPIGRLIQWSNDVRIDGCSFINSPFEGARSSGNGTQYVSKGSITSCHFDSNANLGIGLNIVSYVQFTNCTFNSNGYGYQKTLSTNTFSAFGASLRFRCHHISFADCHFMQNGRDGACMNQGTYAVKFSGCIAWRNFDGGFTLANDVTASNTIAGDGESPQDIEYIDCEAYDNYTSGLAGYCACYNITVVGGRYYNNHNDAGLLPDATSYNNGVYFAAGSTGINVNTKAYDDRQICALTAVSGSGTTRTLTATNWGNLSGTFVSTMINYPQVAFYDATMAFQGYGTITAESSGSVTVKTSTNNGVTLTSITSGWRVTQKLQHNGCMVDNASQASISVDGFGQLPGVFGYYGYKIMSGYLANGQNVLLPDTTLDPINELLLNPSFEVDTSNWSLTAGSGGSAGRVTTTRRSVGSLQLVGGTAASTANAQLDTNAPLYVASSFVEYSMWVYATAPNDGGIVLNWTISASNFSTTVNHPGGGWKLLRIGAFLPVVTGIIPNCFAAIGKTCYFDVGSFRTKPFPTDNRDVSYPSRGLAV